MKKILLVLMLMVMSSFAYTCPAVMEGRKLYNQENIRSVVYSHNISAFSTLSLSWAPNSSTRQYWIVFQNTCTYADATGGGYNCDQSVCSYETVTCPSGQSLNDVGECVAPLSPVCQLGFHNDTSPEKLCIADFPIASTDTLATGSKLINFEDGKMMLLRPDGSAEMWDKNTGEFIFPNRAYNGVIPPSASFNPLSFNPSEPIQYKELTFGDFVAFEFNQAGLALKSVANVLAGAITLPIFMAISTKQQTPEGDIITQKRSANAVSIDLSKMDFSNIDFSEYENTATSTPQTIPNTDIQVQKITTPPNPKDPNNWAGAGSTIKGYSGVVSVGSVISLRPNNPNTALITSPTDVKIATIKPDGSVEATIFDKQDLKNTATNETPLRVKEIKITPEKLANDGTYSQEQTTKQSTLTPSTNNLAGIDLRTGLPEIVDYNPRTGVKDGNLYSTSTGLPVGPGTPAGLPGVAPITPAPAGGTGSIDLSGVTSRLDKISNQLTLENQFFEKLDKATSSETANPIDHVKGQGLIDTFSTSWGNIKSDFDRITAMTDEAQNTIKQGFTFSLAHGIVNECPYSLDFDYGAGISVIKVDFCKSFSPLRPTLYVLFNLFFQSILLLFAFKSITRLV